MVKKKSKIIINSFLNNLNKKNMIISSFTQSLNNSIVKIAVINRNFYCATCK